MYYFEDTKRLTFDGFIKKVILDEFQCLEGHEFCCFDELVEELMMNLDSDGTVIIGTQGNIAFFDKYFSDVYNIVDELNYLYSEIPNGFTEAEKLGTMVIKFTVENKLYTIFNNESNGLMDLFESEDNTVTEELIKKLERENFSYTY